MARIGLVDVDNTSFPNLALGKIARHHKDMGDSVEWVDPMFGGDFDKVYMSKVFTFTPDYDYPIEADEIERGGTGYDIHKVLPNRPSMTFALDKIMINKGKPEWRAEEGKLYFVIHLGQRLS